MGLIKNKSFCLDIDFDSLIVIHCLDMFTTYKDIIKKNLEFIIEDFNLDNSIVITPITKLSDVFQNTKTSLFTKDIISELNLLNESFMKKEYLQKLNNYVKEISSRIDVNEFNDVYKILNYLVNIDDEALIECKEFNYLVKLISSTGKKSFLILFDCDWIDLEIFQKINMSNIPCIFISNDLEKIECFFKNNLDFVYHILKNGKIVQYDLG